MPTREACSRDPPPRPLARPSRSRAREPPPPPGRPSDRRRALDSADDAHRRRRRARGRVRGCAGVDPPPVFQSFSRAVSRAAYGSGAADPRAAADSFQLSRGRFCSRRGRRRLFPPSLPPPARLLSAMNACTSARRAASSCSAAVARGVPPRRACRGSAAALSRSPSRQTRRALGGRPLAHGLALRTPRARRAPRLSAACARPAPPRVARRSSRVPLAARRSSKPRVASRGGGSAALARARFAPDRNVSPSFPENASPSTSASAAASAMSDGSSALASMCACFSLLTRSARSREEDARAERRGLRRASGRAS